MGDAVGDRLDPSAAREHLLTDRRRVVSGTLDCANAVAASWSDAGTTDREAVVGPLRAALERYELLDAYPSALAGCVAAAGGELQARPVAAAPYVAVTSVGPVLRATLDGARLVVTLGVFGVDRSDAPPRYVRTATTPEAALAVEVR